MKKIVFIMLLVSLMVINFVYADIVPGTIESVRNYTAHNLDSRSLDPLVQEIGLISWSIDGLGMNTSTGIIQVEKPAGATVRKAYFFSATLWSGPALSPGDVKLDGVDIVWGGSEPFANESSSFNYYADVTSLVSNKIDTALPGRIDFEILEVNPYYVDGEILAVIFDDPNQTEEVTIAFLFGAQDIHGDQFNIGLAEPIDADTDVFMSLGISFGHQPGGQVSLIDVNGTRLTSSAGGEDDGVTENGALITVGGLDDSYDNPPDPYAGANDIRYDDELYTLTPLLNVGDTQITVETINPSNDDNMFFAAFHISGEAIIGQGCILSPSFAAPFIGEYHIITATLQDDLGNPVVGRSIDFEVTSGPHAGTMDSDITDALGKAYFPYLGSFEGIDIVEADFLNDAGLLQMAENIAEVVWVDPAILPVELSSFSGAFNSDLCSSTLSWTTQSESENMGWNVYRSNFNSFEESVQLNASIISGAGNTSEPTNYQFQDQADLAYNTEYRYWLECLSFDGEVQQLGPIVISTLSEEEQPDTPELVTAIGMKQNYPNPFNPDTQISFILAKAGECELTIYDTKGKIVKKLFQGNIEAEKNYTFTWSGRDNSGEQVASGIYLYKIKSGKYIETKKMILMK